MLLKRQECLQSDACLFIEFFYTPTILQLLIQMAAFDLTETQNVASMQRQPFFSRCFTSFGPKYATR